MAEGSRNFAIYYALTTVLYFFVTLLAFVLISRVAADCQQKCPMLINTAPGRTSYQLCQCMGDSEFQPLNAFGWAPQPANHLYQPPNPSQEMLFQRWSSIAKNVFTADPNGNAIRVKNCYICESATSSRIYQPCNDYDNCRMSGLEGFQPASHFPKDTPCNAQPWWQEPPGVIYANELVSSAITNRSRVTTSLYGVAVFYLLMMLGSLGCFVGYYTFRNKYGVDWSRLSRLERFLGVVCKIAPVVTRLANFLVLFFLVIAVRNIFGANPVCRYATNDHDQIHFFPQVRKVVAFTSFVWSCSCVFGALVQSFMPRDTPFYMPTFPEDAGVSRGPIKRTIATGLHAIITYGP